MGFEDLDLNVWRFHWDYLGLCSGSRRCCLGCGVVRRAKIDVATIRLCLKTCCGSTERVLRPVRRGLLNGKAPRAYESVLAR